MHKKQEANRCLHQISRKGLLTFLIVIAFGFLQHVAVHAEHSKSEWMIDVHFTDYEELYFSLLDITAGPGDDTQFDTLPESAQAMYVAAILDMEVQNGGLCQFFANCGSSYATRVVDSLQMIGLEPMGILYESFLSDNQIDPTDLSSFQTDTIDGFIAQYERYPYDNFDNAYVEMWDNLNFANVMLRYANAHYEAFMP